VLLGHEGTGVVLSIGSAVMTGSGAVVRSSDLRAGMSAAIFGLGGVGLAAVAAAARQLEDQVFPTKCGFLEGKQVISAAEHAQKIRGV
jgi:Zn-dependent alcohol dehydrogenase